MQYFPRCNRLSVFCGLQDFVCQGIEFLDEIGLNGTNYYLQYHVKSLRELAENRKSKQVNSQCDCFQRITTTMPRAPLGSIDSNVLNRKELSPYQRGILLGCASKGTTTVDIRKQFSLPESTIRTTITRASTRHNGVSKPRSGRPKACSTREQRHIIRTARANPRITYQDLIKATGVSCSSSTVYRILKDYGLTNWLAKKRPLLREEDVALRLAWAKERENWTYNDWRKVIWTDECSVERGTGKDRVWVFRTPADKWKKEMIKAVPKGKNVCVMVWAGFWGAGRSELNKMERDPGAKKNGYSADSYLKILDDNLLSIWEPGLIFMHDNAPIHSAYKIRDWLEEHGITVMEWPPYSPDLNPIEHLWFPLKKAVYEVRPDIESVPGGDEKVREVLSEALEEAWARLDRELMDTLIRSMESRVKAVIESEGWYTKY